MQTDRRWLGVILLVSVVLRLVAVAILGDHIQAQPGIFDEISYHTLALRLLGGHGFTFDRQWWPITAPGTPTAHWSYLYTLWLTAIYAAFGPHPIAARAAQAVITGILMPCFAYRLASRALPGPREPNQPHAAALVAAAWTALYGYFVYYTAALMTEAFFMTGVLWSLDCALRVSAWRVGPQAAGVTQTSASLWIWAELGLALAITIYLRQVFVVFVPVLLAWLALAEFVHAAGAPGDRFSATWRHLSPGVLTSASLVAILIAPATILNYHQFNRFVLLNTNAGYAFFWANHPIYGDHFVAILPDDTPYTSLIPADLRALGVNEAALDSALMQRGIGFVLADPARYVRLSLSRIPVYFLFWPLADSGPISNLTRVGSFGLALPFMLLGVGLWLMDWFRPDRQLYAWRGSLLVLFAVTFSLIHILSWALTRYRLPVDAVGVIFAGRALAALAGAARQRAHMGIAGDTAATADLHAAPGPELTGEM